MSLRILILFVLVTVAHNAHSQTDTINVSLDTTKIFLVADKMPDYPGGTEALNKYVSQQVKVPGAIVGQKMFVKVIVRHDGTCKSADLVLGTGNARVDKDVVNALKSITNWIPAQQNGKIVWAQRTVEITFARKN